MYDINVCILHTVAGIWVEGNDNIAAYKRSIIVYVRSDKPKTIQSYWGCYDPLSYPLFFLTVSRDGILIFQDMEFPSIILLPFHPHLLHLGLLRTPARTPFFLVQPSRPGGQVG
uniref:Uncharacterized protein n=1 Tax=Lactuca sativa TaxID=4236 RepID=A0A9R1URK9_LACSA|nr:hypothetical protein LSAT_V11C800411730 [Lactuca sativa]